MKLIRHLVLLLTVLSSSAFAQVNSEAIRVRLEKSKVEYIFEGVGIQILGRQSFYQQVSLPKLQKVKISRELMNDKPVWKVIRSSGASAETNIFIEPILAIKAIYLKKDQQELPQSVFFWPQGKKRFDVVGVLPLEDYLSGVLAGEMPSSWPLHTLKAQAIAARSYALSVMQERKNQAFHVENTVMDQVYRSDKKNLRLAKAVKETENLILVDKKGRTFKSFFHSDCGGKTASAKDVWGQGSRTEVVTDTACPMNPKAQWNFKISQESLSKALNSFVEKDAGNIDSLKVINGGEEERAFEIEIRWLSGETKNILAQDFRQILGFDKMKSTFFQMTKVKDDFVFTGVGYGHGVGMCQWGARALGVIGKDYIEILKHYYPQASLYMRQVVLPESKPLELRLGLLKQRQQLWQ